MKQHSKVGEMLPEYDFSKGVRGKYAKAYRQESNIVILDPDVAKIFPTSKAVNQALRSLVRLQRTAPKKKATGRT